MAAGWQRGHGTNMDVTADDRGERRIQLLLVDDHPLFRKGLGAVISAATDMSIVGEAGDLDEVRGVASSTDIDVALVDVWMTAVGGIAIARELHELQPRCRILGLSVVDEPTIIAEMLRAGAVGFALKIEDPERILDAIRQTAAGVRYLPPRVSQEKIELELASAGACLDGRLTKREREIFELVIQGYTNAEIGARLYIARRTVETHRYRIMKKLEARSVTEMQRLAARYRL
jgi:DNA-binding NarL/FixJ family response regulator